MKDVGILVADIRYDLRKLIWRLEDEKKDLEMRLERLEKRLSQLEGKQKTGVQ